MLPIPDRLWSRGGLALAATIGAGWFGHPDIAAGIAMLSAGVGALEAGLTVRRLQDRTLLELLPEPEFAPSVDDVNRAARLMTHARPRGPLGWAWRSGAVRVRLEAEAGGDVRYTWEVDEARSSALRTAARAYGRVEVRPAPPMAPAGAWAVRELRLSGRAGDALAGLGEATDALQVATRTLEELEAGTYGAVIVDILPASARRQRRQRERLRRIADATAEATRAEGAGRRARDAHRARSLAGRLDPDAPLYRVQAFTVGVAEDAAEAAEIAAQLEATFAQWTGAAHWRRAHGPAAWRRYRVSTGLFGPWRTSVATSHEVGAFLRPPTAANASVRVRRSVGALGRPPAILVPYTGAPEQLPIGAVERRGRPVMLAADLSQRPGEPPTPWFGYIVGGSGSGKSELAILQALHIALRTDGGLLFLDPHGTAIERLLAFLVGTPAESRVSVIDLGRALVPNPGLNLLDRSAYERSGDDWGAAQELSRALRDTMTQAMHWSDRHTRVLALLGRATLALAELGRQLPADLQPTIFELERLLLDPGWRLAVAPLLGSASQRAYWGEGGAFEGQPKDVIGSVLSMGDRLRSSPALSGLLGQSRATWRARDAMDRGDIVLVRTGEEPADAALAATLLVTHVYHAALTRGDLPESARLPFHLFLDELQTFDSEAGGLIGASLEQLRKFGIRLTAMNQDPARLSDRTRGALANNRTHMAAGTTRASVAAWLAAELGGDIDRRSIARLPFHRFISSVKVGGVNSDPFLVATMRAEDVFTRMVPAGGETAAYEALRATVAARSGALRPRVVVEGLEDVEARMLAALGVSEPRDVGDQAPDLAELPADPREAAQVLRFEHEWSFARIAKAQGVSVATVRRRLGLLDERGQKPRPRVVPGAGEAS